MAVKQLTSRIGSFTAKQGKDKMWRLYDNGSLYNSKSVCVENEPPSRKFEGVGKVVRSELGVIRRFTTLRAAETAAYHLTRVREEHRWRQRQGLGDT